MRPAPSAPLQPGLGRRLRAAAAGLCHTWSLVYEGRRPWQSPEEIVIEPKRRFQGKFSSSLCARAELFYALRQMSDEDYHAGRRVTVNCRYREGIELVYKTASYRIGGQAPSRALVGRDERRDRRGDQESLTALRSRSQRRPDGLRRAGVGQAEMALRRAGDRTVSDRLRKAREHLEVLDGVLAGM